MRAREADIRMVASGAAPEIDVILSGSTEVNLSRAQQCAFVAAPVASRARRPKSNRRPAKKTGSAPATPAEERQHTEIRLLTPSEVTSLAKKARRTLSAPDVDLSLFVQLHHDLEADVRAKTVAAVERLTHRARWKQNTAAIEISAADYEELTGLRGVSYVERGQTLRAPDPIITKADSTPPASLRRVDEAVRRHRHGADVLIGIIDVGGFDFAHEDFLDASGDTRWVAIWDQGGSVRPAPSTARTDDRFKGLIYGSELQKRHMDAAIAAAPRRGMTATNLEPQSNMDVGSHGTHVASIAAGNRGVARRAHIAGVLVALTPDDLQAASSFYDSTRIADAVDYLLAVAAELGGEDGPLPVSINISLGTNGHAHDTSSAMARWIDNALTAPGRCVSVAAGNAGQVEPSAASDIGFMTGRIHAAGTFSGTNLRHELGWIVAGGDIADVSENEMEIWYSPQDRLEVEIRPPGGSWIGPIRPGEGFASELAGSTMLSVHNQTYHPANGANKISIVLSPYFGPVENGMRPVGPITGGEWRVRLKATTVRDGRYDAWIERDDIRPLAGPRGPLWRYPSFFAPGSYTDDRMISSLACAERVVSVANVDVVGNAVHITSSRGPTRDGRFKPDIGADGTNVIAANGFDRLRPWVQMTGTSMASPYVCGVAGLMMAISPALTSAQILGIMRTSSMPLPGHNFSWRNDTGFGVIDASVCVQEAAHHELVNRKKR